MDPVWNKTHMELQQSMKKEIDALREILNNLHHEELSLLACDKDTQGLLLQERTLLLSKLDEIRKIRVLSQEKLYRLSQNTTPETPLENLLPLQESSSCETLILRDQMVALMERMQLQTSSNEMLSKISGPRAPMKVQPMPKKKKNSIATLSPEEYDESA